MAKIQNETAYRAAMERIEELLPLTDDNTPLTDKNLIELDYCQNLYRSMKMNISDKVSSLTDVKSCVCMKWD